MAFSTGVSLLPISNYSWAGSLSFVSLATSFTDSYLQVNILPSGVVEVRNGSFTLLDSGNWYTSNISDPPLTVGDFFECRLTLLSGNSRTDVHTFNVWERLQYTKSIRNDSISGSGVIRAEIRELTNTSRITSINFTLNI